MKDYEAAGRVLFGDAFAPIYDAYGAEYAYCEPDVDISPDAYLIYSCMGLQMHVELNQPGKRICLGSDKRTKIPDTVYCYIDIPEPCVCVLFRRIGTQDFVRTLNMKIGIFINGKKIASCASYRLDDGDKVRIGGAEVVYRKRPDPIMGTRYGF